MNTGYKIVTKCIAPRLKQVLPSIVHLDQIGYLKGKYIGVNIRLLSDIIDYTDENDIPGIFVFADFEKAFDKIEHNFINRALKYFKFGNDVIRWIDVF